MNVPKSQENFLRQVMTAATPAKQRALRTLIGDDDYDAHIENAYLVNPFFELTEDEARTFREDRNPTDIRRLIAARDAATRATSPKYSVFCMPKSGSSFVRTALQYALEIPVMSLTSFGTPGASSYFGMNSREQEIDELALTKAILRAPEGFVAQAHTRYSMYLAFQLKAFRITPIVTVRNILDCIVSFDDMMMASRTTRREHSWVADTQFPLPADYGALEPAARFAILAPSLGSWLIGFYLSWKRCQSQGLIAPMIVRYEEDVLDPGRFVARVSASVSMSGSQTARLEHYARNPHPDHARLNVGVSGRGRQMIPETVIAALVDYAGAFRGEFTDDEIRYLIG